LLSDRFKTFFGEPSQPNPGTRSNPREEKETVQERQSRGLEQFFFNIQGSSGLSLLDLGGAVQDNVEFICNLGHRITTQAFLQTLDQAFGRETVLQQNDPGLIADFLRENLDFPDESFDGVLLWDVLQYMSPALLAATVDTLHRITRSKSYMLGFFNADDKMLSAPNTRFRIAAANRIVLTQKGQRKLIQPFNNRNLEKVFARFDSVKFFLTRENLREVIIKR